MATLLFAKGIVPIRVEPADGKAFTLPELQTIVGGYIEAIGTPDGGLMMLNEDGKRLNLPVNDAATRLMRGRLRPDDYIVGTVVIGTRAELGG